MKRIFMILISLVLLLCSCTVQTADGSHSQSSDISDSTISQTSNPKVDDNSSAYSHDNTSSDDIHEIKLDFEQNDHSAFAVVCYTTIVAELSMYARYGDNIYVSQYVDGVFGTVRICNGVETAFFPDASNMYEKDGIIYGVLSEGESYIELTRYYCRFNEDGTYEKLFECWNVFYSGEKVYFYEYIPSGIDGEAGTTNICSANIDGSSKQVLSEDISPQYTDNIICYNDYLIYTANDDGIYVISPDGTINQVVDGSDASYEIEFVNNGFVYYTKSVFDQKIHLNKDAMGHHSLWRVGLDGNNRELLLAEDLEDNYHCFDAVVFSDKLLLFLPDVVRVYTDTVSNCSIYEYESFLYDEIEQISVCGDLLAVVGLKKGANNTNILKTVVYDISGDLVFENVA